MSITISRLRDGIITHFTHKFFELGSPPYIFTSNFLCVWCESEFWDESQARYTKSDILNFYAPRPDGSLCRAESKLLIPNNDGLTYLLSFSGLKCTARYEFPGNDTRKRNTWAFCFTEPVNCDELKRIVALHHNGVLFDAAYEIAFNTSIFRHGGFLNGYVTLAESFYKDVFDYYNLIPWLPKVHSSFGLSYNVAYNCPSLEIVRIINDFCYCFELGKTLHKQWMRTAHFLPGIHPFENSLAEKYISFYTLLRSRLISACNSWIICARRLGVVRDLRRIIAEMLWTDISFWLGESQLPFKKLQI